MAKGHIQKGDVMPWTNDTGSDVPAGNVVDLGDMVGIALGDIADGEKGDLATCEVWELAKKTGVAFDQGDQLYWDTVNSRLDKTNTNTPCGKAFQAAASDATTAQCKLNA